MIFTRPGGRPLGLGISGDRRGAGSILRMATAGGACVVVGAVQGATPALGFGVVTYAGHGRRHGTVGFRELSHGRGVVVRGTGALAGAFWPLLRPAAHGMGDSAPAGAGRPAASAPGSV